MANDKTFRRILEDNAEARLAEFNEAAKRAGQPTYNWYLGKEVYASPLEFEPRQITYKIFEGDKALGAIVVFPAGPTPQQIIMGREAGEAMHFCPRNKDTGTFDFLALKAPERERHVRDGREKQQVLKLFCLTL